MTTSQRFRLQASQMLERHCARKPVPERILPESKSLLLKPNLCSVDISANSLLRAGRQLAGPTVDATHGFCLEWFSIRLLEPVRRCRWLAAWEGLRLDPT